MTNKLVNYNDAAQIANYDLKWYAKFGCGYSTLQRLKASYRDQWPKALKDGKRKIYNRYDMEKFARKLLLKGDGAPVKSLYWGLKAYNQENRPSKSYDDSTPEKSSEVAKTEIVKDPLTEGADTFLKISDKFIKVIQSTHLWGRNTGACLVSAFQQNGLCNGKLQIDLLNWDNTDIAVVRQFQEDLEWMIEKGMVIDYTSLLENKVEVTLNNEWWHF